MLADPVVETYAIDQARPAAEAGHSIDVTLLPGVTDPAAESLVGAAQVLGIHGLSRVATGSRYLVDGPRSPEILENLARTVFANPLIQHICIDAPIEAPFVAVQAADDTVEVILLRNADDERLMAISTERRLSLDINEMRAIRDYYQEIDRDPTDAELEMLAQTWSEHCVHKTFRAQITYTGPAGADPHGPQITQTIDGILKTYIRAATEKVNKPWVRSAFVDNAGIIAFDDRWDLAFKVETHNRPSALEPFGGANTGVGGVIRDVLGVSARPIANTDILFFGPPDLEAAALPEGVLHPRRVAAGVVAGIEDYGNKMGIPTVNGAIHYDRRYTSNPLVFCGCLGILPHGAHRTGARPGDLIVVIGGRTGRDGLRGATFSSMEMDTTTSTLSGGAVQIGHPIHEKQVQEVVLRARDESLYSAITDCGAGGLSSAVGEMGEQVGATVHLERVPLKYPGLRPWEIWLSEAQERMVLAVPPANWARLQAICAGQDVEATAIGTFEPTGRLTLYYGDRLVGDMTMAFLHDGIPQRQMTAAWSSPGQEMTSGNAAGEPDEDYGATLLKLLAMPTIRSKEDVIRRYDHEVQGGTAVKPLVGIHNAGPGDAAVLVPLDTLGPAPGPGISVEGPRAVALSVGTCPQYTDLDPYAMAWAAVDEAMRNLVAVGADPDQVAILDNFSWGNTNLSDRLGSLVRAAQGCHDAAVAYGTPFISGKDSLNNEYLGADGQRHAIPGTLVISAVGIVPDVSKTVTMDLKSPGNRLYVIGETHDELGGSHYSLLHGSDAGTVPQPVPGALKTYRALYRAIQAGYVMACHDTSEGGLAVSLAEMCIASGYGITMADHGFTATDTEDDVSRQRRILFSESAGRLIVEVRPDDESALQDLLTAEGIAWEWLGEVTEDPTLVLAPFDEAKRGYRVAVAELERAWRGVPITVAHGAASVPDANLNVLRQARTPSMRAQPPKVLILHANGTNRDRDAALACQLAGGTPEIVHVNQLLAGERDLLDYHMLVVPGGFSYGDDLSAGMLWALDLRAHLGDVVARFVQDGRPVLGICNGFQTLVKAGVLPGAVWSGDERRVTLTYNAQDRFECRWVYLEPNPASPSLFLDGLDAPFYVPVAHGEGRVLAADDATADRLWQDGLIGLRYVGADGRPAGYPFNPNDSALDIAGLSNPAGNVFGLMPHPENHVFAWQHPRYHRGERGLDGLRLFRNGIRFA
ncbi:MAG: phosphoribosylformylglycinamidine synthase subunit PurL [Chloroflexota bacterium]